MSKGSKTQCRSRVIASTTPIDSPVCITIAGASLLVFPYEDGLPNGIHDGIVTFVGHRGLGVPKIFAPNVLEDLRLLCLRRTPGYATAAVAVMTIANVPGSVKDRVCSNSLGRSSSSFHERWYGCGRIERMATVDVVSLILVIIFSLWPPLPRPHRSHRLDHVAVVQI